MSLEKFPSLFWKILRIQAVSVSVSRLYLYNSSDSVEARYICFGANWQLRQVCTIELLKRARSQQLVEHSPEKSWLPCYPLLCRLTRGKAPTSPFHYLCVSVWIFCDHPRALSPWLSCIDGDTFLPAWMDWFFVDVAIDIFWPQIQGQSDGGWARRYFSASQWWCHQKAAGPALCSSNATARRITNQNTRYAATTKTRFWRKQNPVFVRHCVLASPLAQREVLCLNSILNNRTHSRVEGLQFDNLVQSF